MNSLRLSRYIWAVLYVLVVSIGSKGSSADPLNDLEKAPVTHGRERSFFLVGRLSAILEEMIYFSATDVLLTNADEEGRKLTRDCFDSASRGLDTIVRWLRIERQESSELIRDRWDEVDRCLAIAESLATRLHAIEELVKAHRSTKWITVSPRDAQYYEIGYGSEKLTRSIRLEALRRHFVARSDPLRAELLSIRKHTTERVLMATWLKIVAAGELDDFLRYELKSAREIFPRVFETELPKIW